MTREEAKSILENNAINATCTLGCLPPKAKEISSLNKQIEALNMAIIALQEPEIVHCKDCKLHNSCSTEDVFNFVRLENGFCAVGKAKNN